jgi:hypothetical protein
MKDGKGTPGVSRADRISPEGLARLERQLENAARISDPVLSQWIRRYGEPARALIRKHGRYHDGLEA